METKKCVICGKEYTPTGKNQKYCSECRVVAKNEYDKQWHRDNLEEAKEQSKQWRKDNPEYGKQYYKDNLKQLKEQVNQWQKANPEKVRAIGRKHFNKRYRNLGYIPYNESFEGSHFHHFNQKGDGLYIPEEMHDSIKHNIWTGQGMEKINTVAVEWWVTQVRRETH